MKHPDSTRRQALRCSVAGGLLAAPGLRAQSARADFPSRHIEMWVPWPASGATDITLRLLAELARHDQELAYLGPDDHGRAMREQYAAERQVVERLGLAGCAVRGARQARGAGRTTRSSPT